MKEVLSWPQINLRINLPACFYLYSKWSKMSYFGKAFSPDISLWSLDQKYWCHFKGLHYRFPIDYHPLLWLRHSICAGNYSRSLEYTTSRCCCLALSQCFPYFCSVVTVGFDKREAPFPVDFFSKCGIGVPFIHSLWFRSCCWKFSDSVLLGASHFSSPSLPIKRTGSTNLFLPLNPSFYRQSGI